MRFPRLFACALLPLFTFPSAGGVNSFTATGPDGGYAYDVEFVTGGALLARTPRALYRSTDGGANWTLSRTVWTWDERLMSVNPANRSQVLMGAATEGLLRSTDGGVTWSQVANLPELAQNFVGMVAFSSDGSIAWMAQQNGGSLYRSADAGATWTQINTGLSHPVFAMANDAANAQLIYVRTASGNFRSTDGGSTLTPLTLPPYILSLAASQVAANNVLASDGYNYSVFLSTDGGANWAPTAGQPIPGRQVTGIWYAPGTAGKAFAVDYYYRMLRTLDNGQSWTEMGFSPNGRIEGMVFDPANPSRIFMATAGGIFESTDDGATWAERNRGLREGNVLSVVASRGGSGATYLKSRDLASVYRRTDTGGWNPVGRDSSLLLGLPASINSYFGYYTLGVSQQDPLRLYMGRDGQFGVSGDGGVTWTLRSTIPNMNAMEVSPTNDQVIFMGGRGQTPIRSVNGGASWSNLAGHGLPADVQTFAFDPVNANVVYAAVDNHYPPGSTVAVYKSVDGGANFTPAGWNAAHNASLVWRLVHDPVRANIVYLSAYHGVFKTTDGGATWTHVNLFDEGPTQAGPVDLIIDPQSPNVLYASAWQRPILARSVDGGVSWDRFQESSTILDQFNSIALVPGTRNKIVAVRWDGSREIDFVARVAVTVSTPTATVNTATSSVFTITNAGGFAVSAVRLTATLPASSTAHTLQAASGNCTTAASALTCEIGMIAANSSTTVTVGYTPTAAGSWSATATSYEPDDSAADNTAQVTVNVPAPPPGNGGGGGGGGGGRLDYLLLALLGFAFAVSKAKGSHR